MLSFNYNTTQVTVELGELVDSGVDVWAFDYPVPAETVTYNGKTAKVPFDKKGLEQKILDHYRFRQIGQETVGRWLHYFRTRMREIMPYYCQLYEFEAKWWNIEDPLESYNLTETFDKATTGSGSYSGSNSSESSGSSSGSSSENSGKSTKFSDTPQGSITNLDSYLTTATVESGDSSVTSSGETSEEISASSSSTSEDSGTENYTMTRRGNIGVQPLGTEVKNIREAFINIDLMVINELKDLFLQVY